MSYKTIQDTIGNTPLVQLVRLPGADAAARNNVILGKMEGDNPAGSVKDRAALSMLRRAEERGDIKPGDTLIEPTSGNTGIALAMAAAMRGYRMVLIMPEHLSVERRQTMRAFGAEIDKSFSISSGPQARAVASHPLARSTVSTAGLARRAAPMWVRWRASFTPASKSKSKKSAWRGGLPRLGEAAARAVLFGKGDWDGSLADLADLGAAGVPVWVVRGDPAAGGLLPDAALPAFEARIGVDHILTIPGGAHSPQRLHPVATTAALLRALED